MTNYVALSWREEEEPSPRVGWIKRTIAQDDDWQALVDEPGRLIVTRTERALPFQQLASGIVVLGDIFLRDGAAADLSRLEGAHDKPETFCVTLSQHCWGRYVVLGPAEGGRAWAFRDPMGALDCLTFDAAGVQVVASALPDWLVIGLAPRTAIDWGRLAAGLSDPASLAAAPALTGFRTLLPGELRTAGGQVRRIWRLDQAARRPMAADEKLSDVVDLCVRALVRDRRVLAETSGGLDSAIVAAALAQSGTSRSAALINYHTHEPEGDERIYARSIACAVGLRLIERRKPDFDLSERALLEVADAPRPAIWALDAALDRDLELQCEAQDAEILLTGKGGDTVFYQMATPLILADHLRAEKLRGLLGPVLPDLARWTRRSAWSVLGAAVTAAWRFARRETHPWLEGIETLPPGKRLQLRGLANGLTYAGATRRGRRAHLVHPLLSQPIVEHCLARSSVQLTEARRDRAYARRAFAPRLPPEVAWRYGKGDATAHFGRATAAHLGFLRGFLLDGLLAANGVLDRRRMERLLRAETLIWRGGTRDLMQAAVIEGWARGWTRRLRGLE